MYQSCNWNVCPQYQFLSDTTRSSVNLILLPHSSPTFTVILAHHLITLTLYREVNISDICNDDASISYRCTMMPPPTSILPAPSPSTTSTVTCENGQCSGSGEIEVVLGEDLHLLYYFAR